MTNQAHRPGPRVRIAAVQFTSGADPRQNLALAEQHIAGAAEGGAQVVVLPEAAMCCFGEDLAAIAEPLDGPYATGVREAAQAHGVVVVAGMFTPAEDGRVRNTLLITGPDVDASYDKIHLFDAFGARESDTVAPGEELVTFAAHGVTFGVATCYDLRFADQFTALGRAGAEVVLASASWGEGPGKADQWDVLVRARAMDAQAWLVACDQAWTEPRGTAPLGIGRSAVIDPTGFVRAQLGAAAGILHAEVDPAVTEDVRARVPVVRR